MTQYTPPDVPTKKMRMEFVASWNDWEGAVCVTREDCERAIVAANLAAEELAKALQAYADLPFAIGEAARTALAAYRNMGTP